MSAWQPAETAPYDTPVLAHCVDVKFGNSIEVLKREILPRNQGECWCWGDEYFFKVSHWMPLPLPPE